MNDSEAAQDTNESTNDIPIVSVIYMDFDNLIGGLVKGLEADANVRGVPAFFLLQPLQYWLGELVAGTDKPLFKRRRRFLRHRAYINLRGKVESNVFKEGFMHLSEYRQNLVESGFEIIDCQSVGRHNKSHADVRMTMDILDMLGEPVLSASEIIIVSGDSDFAPLLNKIRAQCLQVAVISSYQMWPGYTALADYCIGPEDTRQPFLERFRECLEAREATVKYVHNQLAESDERLSIATIEKDLCEHEQTSSHINNDERFGWFGCGRLSSFIREYCADSIRVKGHFIWDSERHEPPQYLTVTVDPEEAREAAAKYVDGRLVGSGRQLRLTNIGMELRAGLGPEVIEDSGWFGCDSLSSFIRKYCADSIRVEGHFIWDSERHEPPQELAVTADPEEAREAAAKYVDGRLAGSGGQLLLANIGMELRAGLESEVIEDSDWFGCGSLSSFIREYCADSIRIEGHFVWDSERHEDS